MGAFIESVAAGRIEGYDFDALEQMLSILSIMLAASMQSR